jgi:hypothetical protein
MRTNGHKARLLCHAVYGHSTRGLLPDYRLYYLDDANRIRHSVEFECATDNDADRLVLERTDGRAMELWSGTRLVRKFSPTPERD